MIGTMKTITFMGAMEVPEHGGTFRDTPLVFKVVRVTLNTIILYINYLNNASLLFFKIGKV